MLSDVQSEILSHGGTRSNTLDLPERLLVALQNYSLSESLLAGYEVEIQAEIRKAMVTMRTLMGGRPTAIRRVFVSDRRDCVTHDDPVARDQALWSLVDEDESVVDLVMKSFETAKTATARLSALIALRKLAHHDRARVIDFFASVGTDNTEIDTAEWAELGRRELMFDEPGGRHALSEPVSQRTFVRLPGRMFDTTMPLHFQGVAVTRIGAASVRTVISPAWFSRIFGEAMALVNASTFTRELILEKQVSGLHDDGSPHFEHFPFRGTTTSVGPALYLHNYWADVRRPFYTSGRTEEVDGKHPVLRNVPMTFFRLAMTAAPDRYATERGPCPESVRGVFFGFGHINPWTLFARGGRIRVGDFQISPSVNPQTGKPANTAYYGTFYGKLTDRDPHGALVLNSRVTHCNSSGCLDYLADGTLARDPICPQDWN